MASLGTSAGAAEKWVRLEAEGVTVYSEVSAANATEFLINYVGFRHTFQSVLGRDNQPLGPVHIVLYRKRASLGKITGESPDVTMVTVALTAMLDGDVVLGLSEDGDRTKALRAILEFDTICSLKRQGYFLPLWMEQGSGEVLSTLEMEKDSCVMGPSIDWMIGALGNEKWIPWERFSRIQTTSADYTIPESFRIYAAQSWALMRTVLLRDPAKARERFRALVNEVHRNPLANSAVAKILQVGPQAVPSEMNRTMRQGGRLVVPFDRALARSKITRADAPPVEVAVAVASLTLIHGSVAAEDGALQRAIELAPDSPLVLEAMARRELKYGDKSKAAEYYRSAIAAGTTNPQAFYRSAERRLDDAMGSGRDQPGQGGTPVADALGEIRQAMKLNPGDGQAYVLLGRALFASENLTDDDRAELKPGFDSPEDGPSVRYYDALLQLRLDHYDEAVASLRLLLRNDAVKAERRQSFLREFAAQNFGLVKDRIEPLVHAHDFESARALLNQRLDPTEWNVIAEAAKNLRKWVEVNAALDEMDQLEAGGHKKELRKAQQALVKDYPDEPVASRVQGALDAETGGGN
ncbi:MAG: hypothetical protein ABI222_12460 [Opitutaceae bacterium]